jgi:hypothetical protein
MTMTASIVSDFGTAVGALAGMIVVGGFLAHAWPVLDGASEREVQQATVQGGLVGFSLGAVVVVLSAVVSRLGM